MLWLMMALLVVVAAMAVLRRKQRYGTTQDEPWRASLDDDEPLDMDEIRREEEEWLKSSGWDDPSDDEAWRR
jgi:hypothetical protein